MTSFARRHAREIIRGVVHLWWVFVIVLPLTGFGLWLAVDHANANQARALSHANQQFHQSQILANRKFQQAIRIATVQASYSINKSVCGFRGFVQPTLKSYEAAAKDPTLTASARARNDKRIQTTKRFLESQVTVPADFDCADLPKNPPKATP